MCPKAPILSGFAMASQNCACLLQTEPFAAHQCNPEMHFLGNSDFSHGSSLSDFQFDHRKMMASLCGHVTVELVEHALPLARARGGAPLGPVSSGINHHTGTQIHTLAQLRWHLACAKHGVSDNGGFETQMENQDFTFQTTQHSSHVHTSRPHACRLPMHSCTMGV